MEGFNGFFLLMVFFLLLNATFSYVTISLGSSLFLAAGIAVPDEVHRSTAGELVTFKINIEVEILLPREWF